MIVSKVQFDVMNASCTNVRRCGLSIVELLVTIAIFSVLIAIIVPAVQSARERSRQLQCQNNLRQIAISITSFEEARQHLPNVYKDDVQRVGHRFRVSPHFQLLPYLEQSSLFESILRSTTHDKQLTLSPIPVFRCPTDSGSGNVNYRMCSGVFPSLYEEGNSGMDGGGGAFAVASVPIRMSTIVDGLSNTIACSERLCGSGSNSKFAMVRDVWNTGLSGSVRQYQHPDAIDRLCRAFDGDGGIFGFYDAGRYLLDPSFANTFYNHVTTPNADSADCTLNTIRESEASFQTISFGSMRATSDHSGGIVQAAFLDGSVRVIRKEIDLAVWRAYATRQGED